MQSGSKSGEGGGNTPPVTKSFKDWGQFNQAMEELVKAINLKQYTPLDIVAIGKGGLIPAGMLWQHFPDARMHVVKVSTYRGEGGVEKGQTLATGYVSAALNYPTTLVVDDICDSGTTFKFLCKQFLSRAKYAVPFVRWRNLGLPHFAAQVVTNDDWIVFPWEINNG